MKVPENVSLVFKEDIGMVLDPQIVSCMKVSLQNEMISNLQTFLEAFIRELASNLMQSKLVLTENELIGNFY